MTATAQETAWAAGRLDGAAGTQRVLFGRMYEDVAIEQAAFAGRRRVFAIASAGDTALTLARDHEVVACDINAAQLAYARRRWHGGARQRGAVDRVMAFGRALAPLAGWRREVVREFLLLRDAVEQLEFWRRHLNTWRFRTGFDALLSPRLLRLIYARPLLEAVPANLGQELRRRLERGWARHPNVTNPYAWALLAGDVPFEQACSGGPVEFVFADAAAYLERCEPESFDGFTLSNILDGASPAYAERLRRAVARAARPGAVMVLRSFTGANDLAAQDRSLLWGSVEVSSVR